MACYYLLDAWQRPGRSEVSFKDPRDGVSRHLRLPCGQCIGCRLERSRQWAVRCMHEAQMHERNCFITLTYDDDHVPYDHSLTYPHFQDFLKRLRSRFYPDKIRYYMCGEYGDLTQRPHYHACLFGVHFDDRVEYRRLDSGSIIYTSKLLDDLWGFGYSSIGDVTFESAAYVARYITKKVTGDAAEAFYELVDPISGEIHKREPEFSHMSLKPGIGRLWYSKFAAEVYPHDRVVMRGSEMKPARYYDNILKVEHPELYDTVKYERMLLGLKSRADQTTDRLRVREKVAKGRLAFKKRSLT